MRASREYGDMCSGYNDTCNAYAGRTALYCRFYIWVRAIAMVNWLHPICWIQELESAALLTMNVLQDLEVKWHAQNSITKMHRNLKGWFGKKKQTFSLACKVSCSFQPLAWDFLWTKAFVVKNECVVTLCLLLTESKCALVMTWLMRKI